MRDELDHIWTRVRDQLALVVDEPTFQLWLAPLTAIELVDDRRLVIEAPAQTRRWISHRFGRILQASVELVLGPDASFELAGSDSDGRSPAGHPARDRPARRAHDAGPLGNPKLTFDQFVIGDSNRLAHAAALTVAEMPSQAYNPLFICGPPGVGKTHLLISIANLLLAHDPTISIRATTGESFTNEFLAALADGSTDLFKSRFRDVDVLLFDDVQFLERKVRTEEEFFHTFNALHDSGRQVVLTSDRPPADLQALEDRLRERFQAGLVADVRPPDLHTRLAILRKRAHHDGIRLTDESALRAIAEHVDSNVRTLEGALIRVVAFASLTGRPVTGGLAEEVLASLYPRPARTSNSPRTIADIQLATSEHFGISTDELVSGGRSPRVAWPRQLAMYLSRELTGASLPAIGREFGGRDHTTVLHAHRRASARIAGDSGARAVVESLCATLGDSPPTSPTDPDDRKA